MSRLVIFPYRMDSISSKQLRDRLGALRVYPDKNYRPRENDLIINWGNSNVPNWFNNSNFDCWLNKPDTVKNASNKLTTLRILENSGIKTPQFETNPFYEQSMVRFWDKVIVRHKLTGHSGDGIEIVNRDEPLPNAPLYTEYIPAISEYRVHVFDGNIIDITKKVRTNDEEFEDPTEEEMMIKSHNNGWDFARGGIRFSPRLGRIAIDSVKALGLDFGAVDIIKGEDGKLYVLEVNTACGCADTTLNSYINAIMNYRIKNE